MSSLKAKDLQKEILYLTTLIQSHKNTAKSPPHVKQHKVTPPHHSTKQSSSTCTHLSSNRKAMSIAACRVVHSSRQMVKTTSRNTARHGNRVYRPGYSSGSVDTTHVHEKSHPAHHGNLVYKPNQDSVSNETKTLEAVEHTHTPLQTVDHHDSDLTASRIVGEEHRENPHRLLPLDTSVMSPSKETRHKKQSKMSNFKWKRGSPRIPNPPQEQSGITHPPVAPDTQASHVNNEVDKSIHKRPSSLYRRSSKLANTKYKWRRRSSSGSRDSSAVTPVSPMIAQSKFKLMRASFLRRQSNSPFAAKMGSFRERRLSYRKKHSLVSQRFNSSQGSHHRSISARGKHVKPSKNKVWTASQDSSANNLSAGESGSSSQERYNLDANSLTSILVGHEVKTSKGNKQWVSAAARTSDGYKSRKMGVVCLSGQNYIQDQSRRRLKRLSQSRPLPVSRTRSSSLSNIIKSPSVKQFLASRAVRKSKMYVWNAKLQRKDPVDKSKQYCMFYNRFGKCNHRDTCPYIHDPDKIAVCTKFLRGVCEKTDGTCPFSHKLAKGKMPVCSFFLRGVCTKDECPYLHVSVGRDAQVCLDFAKGYCPRGEECTKQHIIDCPDFLDKGVCDRGKACPLRHRKRVLRNVQEKKEDSKVPASNMKEPFAFKFARRKLKINKEADLSQDPANCSTVSSSSPLSLPSQSFTPLDMSTAPDFIAL